MDPMLPSGLRSAPKIFNAMAYSLEWYLQKRGVRHVFHYLSRGLLCAFLRILIAEHKRDGPTTCFTFLGIEVDTIAGQLRLPADKLDRLQTLLREWGDRNVCQRRELESLVTRVQGTQLRNSPMPNSVKS